MADGRYVIFTCRTLGTQATFFSEFAFRVTISSNGAFSYVALGQLSNGYSGTTYQGFTQDSTKYLTYTASECRLYDLTYYDINFIKEITYNGSYLRIPSNNGAVFSPSGEELFVTDSNIGHAAVFDVTDTDIIYNSAIIKNSLIGGQIDTAAFSPSGGVLILGGEFGQYVSIFSVSGAGISFVSNILKGDTALTGTVNTATYNPAGNLLVLGGVFDGYASVFSVSGTNINYLADITKGGTALTGAVNTAVFSPDGSLLVLGGAFSGYAALFSVSGTTITYIAD